MIYVSLCRLQKRHQTLSSISLIFLMEKYFSHEILLHILNIHKNFLPLGDSWKPYQQESFEHYYYYFLFNKFMNIPIQFAIKIWIYDLRGIWMCISMRFSFDFFHQIEEEKDMNMRNAHSCEMYGRVGDE